MVVVFFFLIRCLTKEVDIRDNLHVRLNVV
jgi:hypothetical protein